MCGGHIRYEKLAGQDCSGWTAGRGMGRITLLFVSGSELRIAVFLEKVVSFCSYDTVVLPDRSLMSETDINNVWRKRRKEIGRRSDLLKSIAQIIDDYRSGEIDKPTPEHVNRWVNQFSRDVQLPILNEINHVFKRMYFSRRKVARFLYGLVNLEDLVGTDPRSFWKETHFLNIQNHGNSQKIMLKMFDQVLRKHCGIGINQCKNSPVAYIYLDDAIFTGNRVKQDIEKWIETHAPANAKIHVITVFGSTGSWYAEKKIREKAEEVQKNIDIEWWCGIRLENRLSYKNVSDVLWPVSIPDCPDVKTYVEQEEKYPFMPRIPVRRSRNDIFSSEEERQLLEREMLIAGVKIRSFCQEPTLRPLGFGPFGLGFGAMVFTFHNCPNNCPLALWWGDPSESPDHPFSKWYPLLPRETYSSANTTNVLF